MTGTRLTRKIEDQEKCASSHPPATGPIATPRPLTADHRPMALARSCGSVKTLLMTDSVDGMMNAAAMPITARAAISSAVVWVNAAAKLAAAKTIRPARNARRRPYSSARAPAQQQDRGERQRVGVDDPLQSARRGVQVPGQGRQGHVHDRRIHDDDQQGQAQDRERVPAAVRRRGCGGRRGCGASRGDGVAGRGGVVTVAGAAGTDRVGSGGGMRVADMAGSLRCTPVGLRSFC